MYSYAVLVEVVGRKKSILAKEGSFYGADSIDRIPMPTDLTEALSKLERYKAQLLSESPSLNLCVEYTPCESKLSQSARISFLYLMESKDKLFTTQDLYLRLLDYRAYRRIHVDKVSAIEHAIKLSFSDEHKDTLKNVLDDLLREDAAYKESLDFNPNTPDRYFESYLRIEVTKLWEDRHRNVAENSK